MLDGRVKTLHPMVDGGLLYRRDLPSHVETIKIHGIHPIDLVCVNLYDFEKALIAFVDVVTEELKKGHKIQLVGFGTFETSERAAREGRNPSTGETMKIEACKAPKFKAGKALKDAVNESWISSR